MKIKADGYFAIIPEWVLYADISSVAVRVYGCLNRYANKDSGTCHPSRATIAKLCKTTTKSVDRALEELETIGAVTSRKRWLDKDGQPTFDRELGTEFTSNEYTVKTSLPREIISPPSGNPDATPRDKNDPQTKELLNQRNESDTSSDEEAKEKPLDEVIAALWWESRQKKPLGKNAWWSLRNVVKAALDRDYTPQEITDALNGYGTVPSLAAFDIRLQKIRPRSIREERMAEMFEYAQTATHNPFDAQPAQKELNP